MIGHEMITQRQMPSAGHIGRSGQNAAPGDAGHSDPIQISRLASPSHVPELDGEEELGPPLAWVSPDVPSGLLVCRDPDLGVSQFIGAIAESRVVRVMKERDEKDREGAVLCASSNRLTANVGRPGRECAACEERGACCFPRWWIAWQCGERQYGERQYGKRQYEERQYEGSGQIFAHTLCRTGTLNFTRYAARLRREGLTPGQVTTRLFVEDACRQTAGAVRRHIQFERVTSSSRE